MKKKISYIVFALIVFIVNQNLSAQILSKESIESPENIIAHKIFYQSDSLKVNGYILEPKVGSNLPVIISNRGGAYSYGAFTDSTAIKYNKFLVDAGYIVFATNYRGNMGSEGKEEMGSGDIDDSINLLDVIDAYPRVDTSRIGMYGFSRGGMVTYWALTKTKRLKAVAIGGEDGNIYEGYYSVNTIQEHMNLVFSYMWPDESVRKEKLKNMSIYFSLDKMTKETPIFLFHASRDSHSNTPLLLKTVSKLHELGYKYSLKVYDSNDHSMREITNEVDRDIVEWFNKYLKL